MLYSEVEDSLSHIGVKGMKWGHRKAEGSTSASPTHPVRTAILGGAIGTAVAKKRSETSPADRKVYRSSVRAARKVVLGEARSYAMNHKALNAGSVVVGMILGGPIGATSVAGGAASANIMRSQGYGKGKSLALGYLGGPIGGIVVTELSARKLAKASN